jgi:hypothetical protein
MIIIYVIAGIIGLILVAILSLRIYYWLKYPFLRGKEPGFKYVYVEDNGLVREVSKDDEVYLTTQFHPTDGARPYIKFSYKERTPDGRLSGFIDRRRVPRKIVIRKYLTEN